MIYLLLIQLPFNIHVESVLPWDLWTGGCDEERMYRVIKWWPETNPTPWTLMQLRKDKTHLMSVSIAEKPDIGQGSVNDSSTYGSYSLSGTSLTSFTMETSFTFSDMWKTCTDRTDLFISQSWSIKWDADIELLDKRFSNAESNPEV
jgi:hypothetical protein